MNKKLLLISVLFFLVASISAIDCDDGDTRQCGDFSEGECQQGVQVCVEGQWGFCQFQKLPEPEVCNDFKDNDCDGYIDEGCECSSGESRKCGPVSEVGICKFGIEYCTSSNEWSGECLNATTEEAEKCGPQNIGDGLDNDCDGEVDEGCVTQSDEGPPITCTNRQKDYDEQGIDCGGPCGECNDCHNGILEKDEQKANADFGTEVSDCGGLNCPKCPTCNDKAKNQGEEGIDCGGPCAVSCADPGEEDLDGDGLNLNVELQKGTDPNSYDTDADGIGDFTDELPLCPNSFCDALRGENEDNCPLDCKEKGNVNVLVLILVIVVLIIVVGVFFYYQFKKSAKTVGPALNAWKGFNGPYEKTNANRYSRPTTGKVKKKEKETDIEKKLRESLKGFDK